jgi:hypothetical protein
VGKSGLIAQLIFPALKFIGTDNGVDNILCRSGQRQGANDAQGDLACIQYFRVVLRRVLATVPRHAYIQ